jgi:hypothetical protein
MRTRFVKIFAALAVASLLAVPMASKVAAYGSGYQYAHSFGVTGQAYGAGGPFGYTFYGTMTATYSITQYGYYGTNTVTGSSRSSNTSPYRNWDATVWNSGANATDHETNWLVTVYCYPNVTQITVNPWLRLSVNGYWSYYPRASASPNGCSASINPR